MKSKKKVVFKTWDQFCLDKLKEIGKASLTKWATAMGCLNSAGMSRIARNLEEKGEIRVVFTPGNRIRRYYEAI